MQPKQMQHIFTSLTKAAERNVAHLPIVKVIITNNVTHIYIVKTVFYNILLPDTQNKK